jgi:2-polyprenyl-6-methoxyphenol hydroxylase-like FAD-dependent oxidoreductase
MVARLLQQSNQDIQVTIFEGESNIDFRSQGGTLDLHEKTGQAALKAGGLFDEFLKYARYDGEAMKICDKKLLCYINMGGSKLNSNAIGTGRPEIDRPKLREILYHSLAEGTVIWKHKLVRADEDLKMHFSDGSVESGFDLIVGADGAWSKVRPSLTDEQPFYSGIGGHAFRIPDAEKTQPELYKLVNRGSLFSTSDAKSITAQYMGEGSINIATWGVRPKDWQKTCSYDVHDAAATKEACKKEYADWDSRLVAFTQVAEDSVVPRDLFMLPVGIRWDHVKGMTVVGDAAHLMVRIRGLDVKPFDSFANPSTPCRRPSPAKELISHSRTLCNSPKPSSQPPNRLQTMRV